MPVRDWAVVDYYAVLGVPPDASSDEIARAFRSLAKTLHPDVQSDARDGDPDFTVVTAAYEVLSRPRERRDYDRVRGISHAPNPPAAAYQRAAPRGTSPSPTTAKPLVRWTPFKAAAAVAGGLAVALTGVAIAIGVVLLQAHDRTARAARLPARATILATADGRNAIRFRTNSGQTVEAREPARSNPARDRAGDTLAIRYLPADPTDVVVDESNLPRDITLWIVAAKLLVGGPVVAGFGHRARRRLRAAAARGAAPGAR